MAILIVDRGGRYHVDPLYQWDKNQRLEISGLTVPNTPEIHFVNKSMSEAFVRQAQKDANGIITVDIPNVILEKPLPIDVYICAYEGDLFRTLYTLQIPVKARTKPSDYIYEKEDEVLSFNALNNRLTDSIANMKTLVNNTVDSVNKKCDDTYESLVIKCDETLDELSVRCEGYLTQLKAQNDESLETLTNTCNEAVNTVNTICNNTLNALTEAFDERVASLHAEVIGEDVISLEERVTNLVTVLNNISIAPSAWSNKTYTISSNKITANSIIDIYYSSASKSIMSDAEPSYTVSAGKVVITVVTVPTSTVVIDCVKVVNDV
jgi:hypothetical protein